MEMVGKSSRKRTVETFLSTVRFLFKLGMDEVDDYLTIVCTNVERRRNMYIIRIEKQENNQGSYIKVEDPNFKKWDIADRPTVFIKLKDARKLKRKLDETQSFDLVEVMKISKMAQH